MHTVLISVWPCRIIEDVLTPAAPSTVNFEHIMEKSSQHLKPVQNEIAHGEKGLKHYTKNNPEKLWQDGYGMAFPSRSETQIGLSSFFFPFLPPHPLLFSFYIYFFILFKDLLSCDSLFPPPSCVSLYSLHLPHYYYYILIIITTTTIIASTNNLFYYS